MLLRKCFGLTLMTGLLMTGLLMTGILVTGLTLTPQASAALQTGAKAPVFTLPASLAGHKFNFSLATALKKGPVVLYFYPAAFTPGCTIEAHDFAEAMDQFQALKATVIGVSMDQFDTLKKFSVSECRNRFAVAADESGAVSALYDARQSHDTHAARMSYVIAPDGKILMSYENRSPDQHVAQTLSTLQQWKAESSR
ncbi:peroxiredoxin [Acetobacter sp.]|jgi:peroxiredoxin|uniref:peroxiredoxin n=1 Tax=Acetobacter sp. TaxID=440 RepID=UPI0025C3CC0B|nr:peroxiredoxin [Acetobacter sp.]MCH4089895.1 peroxiredoxin [Acetobacter sp.]MCI1298591.1 peroxiredoxin [Acetobacter sp.]MCI1315156.1 peroxiredoxin [Acetobacter sp.]